MTPKITSAEYVRDYTIRIRFEDGRHAEVDLKDELWGEVFEPLKDPAVFQNFRVDEELNTLAWPTGADLAPEFLYGCGRTPRLDRRRHSPRRPRKRARSQDA